MTKYKNSKGHGNGYHDSAVYKINKMKSFNRRVHDAIIQDQEIALANNRVLEVDDDISTFIISQMCIFCHHTELVKVKENYFKCPKCGFKKIKKGVIK